MSKQTILCISREFGSGGHEIAEELAKRFNFPIYDRSILENIALDNHLDASTLKKYDERPRNFLTSRRVKGFSNSLEENIAQMQFRYLRRRAETGESFIVLGRCGEEVLADYEGMISIFILSDIAFKKERTLAKDDISEEDALELMHRMDRRRKYYHNQYCNGKWGDSRNYDLCINSARMGILGTTNMLEQYVRERMNQE